MNQPTLQAAEATVPQMVALVMAASRRGVDDPHQARLGGDEQPAVVAGRAAHEHRLAKPGRHRLHPRPGNPRRVGIEAVDQVARDRSAEAVTAGSAEDACHMRRPL